MIQFLLLMAVVVGQAKTDSAPGDPGQEHRLTCRLSSDALSDRMGEIHGLFAGSTGTRELEDGYSFRFPGDGDWADRLLRLIRSERRCCQFFTFELSFEPNRGPVWFRVRGSQEVKAFLETLMRED